MKTTSIMCDRCGATFEKRTADYNKERRKNPECKFFCTLSCHGKRNVSHLKGLSSFADNPDLQKKALAAASVKNTKYVGDDKIFARLIRKCKQREKDYDLTLDFLKTLWNAQHGKCALSSIPLDLYSNSLIDMPSIDRIDSAVGYIQGNVQFVSCAINFAKSNMSNDDALKLLQLICEHYPNA